MLSKQNTGACLQKWWVREKSASGSRGATTQLWKMGVKPQVCPWHFSAPRPLLEAARGVWDAPRAGISKQPGFHHWISAAPSWTFHGFAKLLWLHKWKMQRLSANLSLKPASQEEENSSDAGHFQTRCCSCYSQVAHLYSPLFNLYPEL